MRARINACWFRSNSRLSYCLNLHLDFDMPSAFILYISGGAPIAEQDSLMVAYYHITVTAAVSCILQSSPSSSFSFPS
jgi:hypothetical protein